MCKSIRDFGYICGESGPPRLGRRVRSWGVLPDLVRQIGITHFLASIGLLFVLAVANAATFTVTNTNDSGAGSLRQAVIDANLSGVANTINFAVTGAIVLTSGQIRIESPLNIVGPGVGSLAIDGNASSRIFTIVENNAPACPALSGPNDFAVSISGLTLRNGSRNVANSSGGAIVAEKSLTLNSVIIRDSAAKNGGGVGFFVQYPGQSLTIANSQFINNVAKNTVTGNTGGNQGGALFAKDNCPGTRMAAAMTIDGSVFSGNQVQPTGDVDATGGAVALDFSGPVVIQDTRIVDNHADSSPLSGDYGYNSGGIGGYAKSLTIRRSEIAQNSADFIGGIGAFNVDANLQGAESAMQFTIVDSTVSGNVANQSLGGIVAGGNVAAIVANSTVAANVANWLNQEPPRVSNIGLYTDATNPPSRSNATPPTLQLASSIVAGGQSSSPDIGTLGVPVPFSVTASNSLVQFLDSNVVLAGSGNLVAVDPMLGPLAFNSGTTRTRALLAGSPVINGGSNPLNLTTDQRGTAFPRVVSGTADMGAFEYNLVSGGSAYSLDYVQKAYVAYYGRPADPPGQTYWATRMDAEGGSLNAIIGAFGYSAEFNTRYGQLTNTQLVTRIYQQALGRDPDQAGLDWYVAELVAGRRTLQTITLDVLNGATTAPDSTVVANKLGVAAFYSAKVAAGCPYGTEQDGVNSLSGVTADPITVAVAQVVIGRRCGP